MVRNTVCGCGIYSVNHVTEDGGLYDVIGDNVWLCKNPDVEYEMIYLCI